MNKRQFITLLGGGAVAAWPFAARGQQTAMPAVGVLHGGSAAAFAPFMVAFRRGLRAEGFTEGQNVTVEQSQQGIYAERILKGEKAAELPVVRLSKFELMINLNTARALGLAIPPGVLAIADELIE